MQEAFAALLAHVHSRQGGAGVQARHPARPQDRCWCPIIIRRDKMVEERGLGKEEKLACWP